MAHQLINMLASILALIVGGIIGVGFGMIQDAARRKNERFQEAGKLKSGWAVIPGSGKRVAYLMVALILVQVICPLLFQDSIKWWVAGGVAGGYGFMLFWELRQRLSQGK